MLVVFFFKLGRGSELPPLSLKGGGSNNLAARYSDRKKFFSYIYVHFQHHSFTICEKVGAQFELLYM